MGSRARLCTWQSRVAFGAAPTSQVRQALYIALVARAPHAVRRPVTVLASWRRNPSLHHGHIEPNRPAPSPLHTRHGAMSSKTRGMVIQVPRKHRLSADEVTLTGSGGWAWMDRWVCLSVLPGGCLSQVWGDFGRQWPPSRPLAMPCASGLQANPAAIISNDIFDERRIL